MQTHKFDFDPCERAAFSISEQNPEHSSLSLNPSMLWRKAIYIVSAVIFSGATTSRDGPTPATIIPKQNQRGMAATATHSTSVFQLHLHYPATSQKCCRLQIILVSSNEFCIERVVSATCYLSQEMLSTSSVCEDKQQQHQQ